MGKGLIRFSIFLICSGCCRNHLGHELGTKPDSKGYSYYGGPEGGKWFKGKFLTKDIAEFSILNRNKTPYISGTFQLTNKEYYGDSNIFTNYMFCDGERIYVEALGIILNPKNLRYHFRENHLKNIHASN